MSIRDEVKNLYQRGQRLSIEGNHEAALQLVKQANEKG
jgi:hypothetical protein